MIEQLPGSIQYQMIEQLPGSIQFVNIFFPRAYTGGGARVKNITK